MQALRYDRFMLGTMYDSQACSIARSLEVVGERWSILIIRDAIFAGSTRYSEFRRSLGIATNVLQARLDGFVEAGIMRRDGADYLLTEKGRDLAPALIALTEWGDRWSAPDGPPIDYHHSVCDAPVHSALVCEHCGTLADAGEVVGVPGPGMPQSRLDLMGEIFAAREARTA